jgi:FkbM family methyltransferase
MIDINDLQLVGHSTTSRAWITNPARRGLFLVARPYLAELTRALSNLSAVVARHEDLDRIDADIRHHSDDVAASLRQSAAMKEELQRFGILMDGLSKDRFAWAQRLGSLEDSVDSGGREANNLKREMTEQLLQLRQLAHALQDRQQVEEGRIEAVENGQAQVQNRLGALEQQVKALAQHIEAIHAPAGMATLMPHQPLAIPGTSLVLSLGPYGCFVLRQPDLISDHVLAGSFWDSHLKPVIERAGRPDGSAIDAGAYLGFHSAYMSRFFRVVHAFEPQVEIYRMLCANLLLNNCRNVKAVNGALYDIPGQLRLADSANQEIPLPVADGAVDYDRVGNAAALTFQLTDDSDARGVCAQTIDQLGLTDLAFIKVDTQGSDLHVLKGAHATIQRCRPVITVEYERELAQGHGDTLEDYYCYFNEMAYEVQVLVNRSDGKQIDLLATPR